MAKAKSVVGEQELQHDLVQLGDVLSSDDVASSAKDVELGARDRPMRVHSLR
jgi:hypothetical protein